MYRWGFACHIIIIPHFIVHKMLLMNFCNKMCQPFWVIFHKVIYGVSLVILEIQLVLSRESWVATETSVIALNTYYSGVRSDGSGGVCCSLEAAGFNLRRSASNSPESIGLCPVGGKWYGEKPPQSIPRKIPPDPGEVVDIVGPPAPVLKEPKGLLPEIINWVCEEASINLPAGVIFLAFVCLLVTVINSTICIALYNKIRFLNSMKIHLQ